MTRRLLPLLALAALAGAARPAAADPVPPYAPTFGLTNGIIAIGSPGADVTVSITYYGWEQSTVFGHSLWAFTAAQYASLAGSGCAGWLTDLAPCSFDGELLFGQDDATGDEALGFKGYGTQANPHLGGGTTASLSWFGGEEIIFALLVNQGNGWSWWFSGDATRNRDGYGHLGFFSPATFPNGIPENPGGTVVPQTAGKFLFGFEDGEYGQSDWDFNNAIFALEMDEVGVPTETVPEPATMALLATGLAGMAAARRRRRESPPAE